MKRSHFLLFTSLAAALVALVWQARTITDLRAEVGSLRRDLKTLSEAALDKPTDNRSAMSVEGRDQLELIKLRHQVRELKEDVTEAHSRERMAGVRSVLRSLVPTPAPAAGTWKVRQEWAGLETLATNQYVSAMAALNGATNDYARFLCHHQAARMSFAVGLTEDARRLATDMMALDEKYSRGDPEKAHGDVVHDGNLVLGRIALDEGRVEDAKRHLLAAGKSRGSPVLGSFGPSMTLAKDLLEKGEQETVLQYLEMCGKFWQSSELENWTKEIHAGRIPDFGGSLRW
jgi:hypothetical protein